MNKFKEINFLLKKENVVLAKDIIIQRIRYALRNGQKCLLYTSQAAVAYLDMDVAGDAYRAIQGVTNVSSKSP